MNYWPLVNRTWDLADVMLSAAGRPLHVTVMVADEQKNVLAVKSNWAGGENPTSRAPYFGPKKADELVESIRLKGDLFAMTPVLGFETSSGFMGGVRRMYDGRYVITACSAWDERADALMALVLNHAMVYETRFHHVGFRHPTEEAFWAAIERDQLRLGVDPLPIWASDHAQYFFRVEEPRLPNGVYWIEHQFHPQGNKNSGIHWDMATSPGLLGYLGVFLDIEPRFWVDLAGPNDPIGMLQLTDRDGMQLAVMERPNWHDVDILNLKRRQ